MPISNLLAVTLGYVLAAIGLIGVAAPSVLLEYSRFMQSATALYVIAAVRVVFGAILVWAAPDSRTPRTLRIIGIFIIIAGLATPFFGIGRTRAAIEMWSTQSPSFTRAWPIVAIGLGLFIAYVALPRRTAP